MEITKKAPDVYQILSNIQYDYRPPWATVQLVIYGRFQEGNFIFMSSVRKI